MPLPPWPSFSGRDRLTPSAFHHPRVTQNVPYEGLGTFYRTFCSQAVQPGLSLSGGLVGCFPLTVRR